jgi:hypothetical protein
MTNIVARETGEKREPLALPPLERESLSFTGKGDLMRSNAIAAPSAGGGRYSMETW